MCIIIELSTLSLQLLGCKDGRSEGCQWDPRGISSPDKFLEWWCSLQPDTEGHFRRRITKDEKTSRVTGSMSIPLLCRRLGSALLNSLISTITRGVTLKLSQYFGSSQLFMAQLLTFSSCTPPPLLPLEEATAESLAFPPSLSSPAFSIIGWYLCSLHCRIIIRH